MPEMHDVENLVITMEECAEIVQIASKCIRFGLDDYHPGHKGINRILLAREIGNLLEMVNVLIRSGVIDEAEVRIGMIEKARKLPKWTGHPGSMLISNESEKEELVEFIRHARLRTQVDLNRRDALVAKHSKREDGGV